MNKQWSFCICADNTQPERVGNIIDSIDGLNIPKEDYEIIVCQSPDTKRDMINIPFDESSKPAWITRKKNLMFQKAKFENISVVHDYFAYDKNWYNEFKDFETDWDVVVCRIEEQNGGRFRDWVSWRYDYFENGIPPADCIQWIDYKDRSQTALQYVSGGAYCIKKDFALKYPLDEVRTWGQSEDVQFSFKVRNFWKLHCNPKSIYRMLKDKQGFWPPKSPQNGWKPEFERPL